jgi:hypothetical protein
MLKMPLKNYNEGGVRRHVLKFELTNTGAWEITYFIEIAT